MIQVHEGKRGRYNNALTGRYIPLHPEKYKGDAKLLIFKSSLEYRMMRYLDQTPNVVSWSYESFSIKYFDPIKQKIRRYYLDFRATIKTGSIVKTVWIEIKPMCECKKPSDKASPEAKAIWVTNSAKWDAATKLARSQGCEFHVINESILGK